MNDGDQRIRRLSIGAVIAALAFVAVVVYVSWKPKSADREAQRDEAALDEVTPLPKPPAPSMDFAGSKVCAECHSDIALRYQTHPMAHATASIAEAPIIEDYSERTSFARPQSRKYRVERQGDKVFHHEAMIDAKGETIYDQAVEVHYAVGSGERGRTYLIDRHGPVFESPITWYTQAARWDLSPGYPPGAHQRFERRALDGCLECHVGRLSFDREQPDRFASPPVLEGGISCERCHGPAQAHVDWHRNAEPGQTGSDPIVNPARLEPGARGDVCYQCHLPGDRILRYGRTAHDFRPGQRLEEIWTVFLRETQQHDHDHEHEHETPAVSQVGQMRTSVCFLQSDGQMGCTSCHDPHGSPPAAERAAFYRTRCLSCHAERGCALPIGKREAQGVNDSCIACHMKPFAASNVPHTVQTDHRILREPGAVSDAPDEPAPELFDSAEDRLTPLDLDRARGLQLFRKARGRFEPETVAALERLFSAVTRYYPDDVEVLAALGSLSMHQRRPDDARKTWLKVLERRPGHETTLFSLATLEAESGNAEKAVAYYEQLIAVNPSMAEPHGRLAQQLWALGRHDEAIAAAEHGLELDPTLSPLRKWLAATLRQANRVDEAKRHEQLLERMQGR